MSAYEQDHLVKKMSVVLSKPDDWEEWLFVRKHTANRRGLWPYVNPGLSMEELKQIQDEKPQEIPVWKFKKARVSEEEQQDIDIEDLSAEELAAYDMWASKFELEKARWMEKEDALRDFNSEIAQTIDVKHIGLIFNCSGPYSRLTTLKKHLCPSVGERNYSLRSRYRAVCTRPRKANLDAWFDEWVTITRLLTDARMPEIDGNRSQEDFILSIRGLDDKWVATQLHELIEKDQRGEQYTSTADLVAEFRSYYRCTRPIASSLGTFATLGAAAKPDRPISTGGSTRRVICLCGDKHKFRDCPYVNHSLRQRDWRPKSSIQRKFDKLRQQSENPASKVLKGVEAQLRKDSKLTEDVEKQSVISMDDGQPVRNTAHCNITMVYYRPGTADQNHPPLPARWILDPGSNCYVTNTKGPTGLPLREESP